ISFPLLPLPPISTLFPYTTLFRSQALRGILRMRLVVFNKLGLFGASHELGVKPTGLRLEDVFYEHENLLDGTDLREGIKLASQRSEEHTSELQSRENLVCRLLLEK